MPHPIAGYRTKDGKRVPGVTTIISKFKESGGLIHWAWQLGIDGLDYRKVRDDAANIGTLAHELVDRWIRKEPLIIEGEPDQVEKARNAFMMFEKWAKQSRLQITESEVGIISEKYRFGGTLDAMLVDDQLSLGDWKSSNRIYSDYLLQLAAYGLLWEEARPDKPITGGYYLMRFAKESPDFAQYHWAELEDAKRGFILMRELYDLKAKLDKRVGQ